VLFYLLFLHQNALSWLWQTGSRQCQTKSNLVEQNLLILFYTFCTTLLILRTKANSAQNSVRAESQNTLNGYFISKLNSVQFR